MGPAGRLCILEEIRKTEIMGCSGYVFDRYDSFQNWDTYEENKGYLVKSYISGALFVSRGLTPARETPTKKNIG